MSAIDSAAVRRDPADRQTDMWLVLGPGLTERPITGLIADALTREFGERFAVVYSEELLIGLRRGRPTLHDLKGRELIAPRLAYGRVWTPAASANREITLLRHLESMGTVPLNSADAVLICLNKFWQMQQLARAGLPTPDTLAYAGASLDEVIDTMPLPCVVKAVQGHRGEQVFLAPDTAALREIRRNLDQNTPYLFQDYVAHSHGRDLRVVVIDGRAVGAQVRAATEGEFRSNLALGAIPTPCTGRYPQGERLVVQAAIALGLGVAGVDLLFTSDNGFTICEVNANVGWREERKEITAALVSACRNRLTRWS
ncbi:RimK family alpha-L-glutamate ligase [Streptomyces sp. NBC_00388]|uniref:RimK family alpha-L-glutamate ligase n=1 Tax=Streptomyces sp. NBC_00388 TaxID=2975735 RepID=UPI002E1B7E6F